MSRAADLHRSTRRFVAYVHWSMYVILLSELWVVGVFAAGTVVSGAPLIAAMLLVLGHLAATLAWLRWSLRTTRHPVPLTPRQRWLVLGYLLLTALTCVAAPLTTGMASGWPITIVSLVALSTSAFAPRLSWWLAPTIPGVAAILLLLGISPITGMSPTETLTSTLLIAAFAVFVAATFWLSGWMLRVMYALEDARGQSAQLAIAEERLRISRDLHDVFGRTLATVAVKSELAAELARRGRTDRAADEMSQVRQISDDAGREVRRIVAGVRDSDLAQELVGARSLLASAGVECRLINQLPEGLVPVDVSAVLGAVVREAVTNVIRHSRARNASITVDLVGAEVLGVEGAAGVDGTRRVRLVVLNDGVRDVGAEGQGGGHGLVGMTERLDAVAGTVQHRRDGASYRLTAEVPLARVAGSTGGATSGPDPASSRSTDTQVGERSLSTGQR